MFVWWQLVHRTWVCDDRCTVCVIREMYCVCDHSGVLFVLCASGDVAAVYWLCDDRSVLYCSRLWYDSILWVVTAVYWLCDDRNVLYCSRLWYGSSALCVVTVVFWLCDDRSVLYCSRLWYDSRVLYVVTAVYCVLWQRWLETTPGLDDKEFNFVERFRENVKRWQAESGKDYSKVLNLI